MSRIDALVAAMTLDEKIGQLTMVSAGLTPVGPVLAPEVLADIAAGRAGSVLNLWGLERVRAVQRVATTQTRLGIPLLIGFDVLHGHRTIFPIPLGEAAAFDPPLWEATAREAAIEAAGEGVHWTFAPMIDVSRDPRWGRIAESAGEDPWLNARFGEAKVRGFQGTGNRYAPDRVAATAKHLAGYGASIAGMDYAAIDVSDRTLHEVYLAPFRAAVEAGVETLMPAFVNLAGVPMTANRRILHEVVRDQWGFDGVIVSDYLAVAELLPHGVAADAVEAAALALNAGVDIDMVGGVYARGLPEALEAGLVDLATIDASVRRVLALKERLGLFDDPMRGAREGDAQSSLARRALARTAACRSIVLLKNDAALLPLASTVGRIALIGPLADADVQMLGPWAGAGRGRETVSILDGLRDALPGCDIRHAPGVQLTGPDSNGIGEACRIARDAEIVILSLGEAAEMAGEAASRAVPGLPGRQQDLADAILTQGRPVVLLLSSGRPLLMTPLIERAQAVVATWFPGSEAGHAIADVLVGRCDATGRLPVTWPRHVGQVPIYFGTWPTGRPFTTATRYTTRYIDMPVDPLYPFGHGLSYTRFAYADLRLRSVEVDTDGTLIAEVDVTNEGSREGEDTVFLFIRDLVASAARPMLELKAMAKVRLAPGERRTVTLEVPVRELEFLDAELQPRLEPGEFEVYVGPTAAALALLRAKLRVR